MRTEYTLTSPIADSVKWSKAVFILLAVMHLAGLAGYMWPEWRPHFLLLTPFNLLATTLLVFLFHKDFNLAFLIFSAFALLVGFFVEVAGVSTGLIFGNYAYGATLGPDILEVPLVIGVNWLLLTYCSGSLCNNINASRIIKATVAATLMVILDAIMEPVAMVYDFWQWEGGVIPFQNYVAWWVVAYVLLLLFYYLPFKKANTIAGPVFLVQFIFFLLLLLFINFV